MTDKKWTDGVFSFSIREIPGQGHLCGYIGAKAHSGDTPEIQNQAYVRAELKSLMTQAAK